MASSPDNTGATILAVFIGGLISAAVSFGGAWWNGRQQAMRDSAAFERQKERDAEAHRQILERERLAHSRALRDSRRERLREAYKVILDAAEAYQYAIVRLAFLFSGEDEKQRNEEVAATLRQALAPMNQAMAEITLENMNPDVRATFDELQRRYRQYLNQVADNKQYSPHIPFPNVADEQRMVDELAKRITRTMQDDLRKLESEDDLLS